MSINFWNSFKDYLKSNEYFDNKRLRGKPYNYDDSYALFSLSREKLDDKNGSKRGEIRFKIISDDEREGGFLIGISLMVDINSALIYYRNYPEKFIDDMENIDKYIKLDLLKATKKSARAVKKSDISPGNKKREIAVYNRNPIIGGLNDVNVRAHCFEWYINALKTMDELLRKTEQLSLPDPFGIEKNKKTSYDSNTKNKTKSNTDKKVGNTILYGVPGSGKSYNIKTKITEVLGEENNDIDVLYNDLEGSKQIKRIVFHPDYTYSDFVGQILPGLDDDKNIKYEFKAGPFTEILKESISCKDNEPYFLIIEEINRGNAPAIFGDIFQLLDRDDSGRSEYSINNEDIINKLNEKTESEEDKQVISSVYLPSNLWIFATMNTSDQNVYTLDTAFQRRWNMELIPNRFTDEQHGFGIEGLHNDKGMSKVTWKKFAEAVNKKLAESDNMLASGDKSLGAWFVKPDKKTDKELDTKNNMLSKETFANKVLKYLWDDAFKFNREDVFSNDMQTLENVIYEKGNIRDDFKAVFNDGFKDELQLNSKEEIEKLENNKETISQPEESEKANEN